MSGWRKISEPMVGRWGEGSEEKLKGCVGGGGKIPWPICMRGWGERSLPHYEG